jgi:serine/threonine protein kinase
MDHPNILKFHEALLSDRNCYIVTEFCEGGNLEDRILTKKPFSDQELANIIFDVYQGLRYLRQMKVCHRDLKTANIFFSGGKAKIADFGLAKLYK